MKKCNQSPLPLLCFSMFLRSSLPIFWLLCACIIIKSQIFISCSRFHLLLIEIVTEKPCFSNQFLQYFFLIPVKTELRLLRGIYHCSLAGHLEYICSACCQGLNPALLLLKLHSMFWTKATGCKISCHPRSYAILEITSSFFLWYRLIRVQKSTGSWLCRQLFSSK